MKIALCQINPTIADFEGNFEKIIHSIASLSSKVDVCVFPELAICGYPPLDLIFDPHFITRQNEVLQRLAVRFPEILIILGAVTEAPAFGDKPFCNSALLITEGKIVGRYDKICLPTYDVFDERRYFSKGGRGLVFPFKGKKLGISICEDVWPHSGYVKETNYAQDPVLDFSHSSIDCLINISASPYEKMKWEKRVHVCQKAAEVVKAPVLMCCQVGAQDGIIFDGQSLVVDKQGDLIAKAKGFEEDTLTIDLNHLKSIPFTPLAAMEELKEALVLGIRDFFHKQKFTSCVLGLSGGIDSAVVLALAVDALGKKHVKPYMLPSVYTSKESLEDAKLLAEVLGVSLLSIPITQLQNAVENTLKLDEEKNLKNITHQNIQSRLRGLLLMAISNNTGALLLTTGNKSELAVGYATLYGDMCGAISPLGDLYKAEVYDLAKWYNRQRNLIPERAITREPTAELYTNQKDQDTLPPYPVLDQIIRLHIEEGYSKNNICERTRLPEETVDWVVRKIHQVEYKRQQYAPILKVSKKAFNTGRKVPIVERLY